MSVFWLKFLIHSFFCFVLWFFFFVTISEQRIKTFGIVSTFVATRSGLTRFKDYRSKDEIKMLDDLPFYHKYDRFVLL